jgi:tetratricopeptide (TPR) repeat protein
VRTRILLIIAIILVACAPFAFAEQQKEPGQAELVDSLKKAVREAKDPKEEALLRKKLGDYYASQEDYKQASDEYMKALSLSQSSFTAAERLQMATSIFWADRLDDAIAVLRSILAENQNDRDARVQLAKVLSLNDKLVEAESEADIVLKDFPDDQDALVVKANTLRWRGDSKAAIPIYEKALAQGEDFDARIGLAHAYLDIGEEEKAREISKPLKPLSPAQEKDLSKLSDALCGVRGSHIGMQYSYYKDSDDNRVNRSSLSYGFWAGRWETEFSYRLTDAKDPLRHEKAEDLWLTTRTKMGSVGAGAGIGMSVANGSGDILDGQASADMNRGWWTVGVSATRELLSDTAELIQNRIVRTGGALNFSETATPRLSFTESYAHSGYSDNNDADDLQLGARYEIPAAPFKIAPGYRFRYWNFRRQSGDGYFDPSDFLSHQLYVSLYAESNGYYVFLEPYFGHQSFTRYGESSNDFFSGFYASAGWQMKKCTSFEINGEGGNYAGGATAGFNYYQVGFKLLVYF